MIYACQRWHYISNSVTKNIKENSILITSPLCNLVIIFLQLKNLGFEYIDGMDPSQGMLDLAKEKSVYKNLYLDYIGDKETLAKDGKIWS